MGMAYTLSKSEGMQGWDFMTEELGGKEGLRDRYYGPPAGNPKGVQDGRQDRRHVVVVNYSYMIPGALQNVAVLKHVLRDWEASGVSTFMTGSNVNPTCNTNLSGDRERGPVPRRARRPLRARAGSGRRRHRAGTRSIRRPRTTRSGRTSTWPRSVARCRNGEGNIGNSVQGQLRHPGWQNWDFTLARRIPVNIGRGGSVRVQAQFYNVFDLTQFQRLAATYTFAAPTASNPSGNTNTTTGEYDESDQPVQLRHHDPHGLLDRVRYVTHTPGPLRGPGVFYWQLGVNPRAYMPTRTRQRACRARDSYRCHHRRILVRPRRRARRDGVRRDDRRRASRHRRPQHPRSDRRRGGSRHRGRAGTRHERAGDRLPACSSARSHTARQSTPGSSRMFLDRRTLSTISRG